MAVEKNVIKQAIKDLSTSMASTELDQDNAIDAYADGLAQIIANAILSAQVNAGISVSTTGTATAQQGATTSPGSLS